MEIQLVANITSDSDSELYSPPYRLSNIDGNLFFIVSRIPTSDISYAEALWTSDGTSEGTHPVFLFDTIAFNSLADIDGTFFFSANDGVSGNELWVSDGTIEGTELVLNINLGERADQYNTFYEDGSSPTVLINVDGTLFFLADDGIHGSELWTSDGTSEGTQLVRDIRPENGSEINNLIVLDEILFFTAKDGQRGEELWMSNGTPEGTTIVRDINPYASSSPSNLVDIDGTLYFTADDGVHGRELWTSDGTYEGTELVRDIDVADEEDFFSFDFSDEDSFAHPIGDETGNFIFVIDDGVHGRELWTSDGTYEGTNLVQDINVGEDSSFGSDTQFIDIGGTIFFTANDGIHGGELWKTDGTPEGTSLVDDINPGEDGFFSRIISFSGSVHSFDPQLIDVNDVLFFIADDGVHGRELWTSDGTLEGTNLVRDIELGEESSFKADFIDESQLIDANGTLFFTVGDLDESELWKTDGTSNGTELVASGGNILTWDLEVVDNNLFFSAAGINGMPADAPPQLWSVELDTL